MENDFLDPAALTVTRAALFGLCNDPPESPAFLDEADKSRWIAIVENEAEHSVSFAPAPY